MPRATNAQLPTGTVTFLFTDIEGSTRLLTQMGDRYTEVLAGHAEIMRSAIINNGGTEVATEGDSFFAAFSSATEALAAAATAQRTLAASRWPEGRRSGYAWACTPARGGSVATTTWGWT